MVPEAPLHIAPGQKGEDAKASNSDSVRSDQTMENALESFIIAKAKELNSRLFEENESLKKENGELRENCIEFSNEHRDLRKEIRGKDMLIAELRKQIGADSSSFNYFLDTRTFKGADEDWIRRYWDNAFSLCELKDNKGEYIINAKAHIVPLLILTQKGHILKWEFTGTYDDFAYAWNRNIVGRFPFERREKLRLTDDVLKAAVNDKARIWKCDVSEWGRKAQEGTFEDVYERAEEIKKQMKTWGL